MKTPHEIDPVLTATAIDYGKHMEAHYIADQIMPRVGVDAADFKYRVFNRDEELDLPDGEMSRTGRASELYTSSELKTESCKDYGFTSTIANYDEHKGTNASTPMAKKRAVKRIQRAVWRGREHRVSTTVLNPANYVHEFTLAGADKLDHADQNPIEYILNQLAQPLIKPNLGIMGALDWARFRTLPGIVKAAHGNDGDSGAATRKQVADLFELDDIIIGHANVNVAKPGAAPDIRKTWGGALAFIYRDKEIDTEDAMVWGYTAQEGKWRAADTPIRMGQAGIDGGSEVFAGERLKEMVVVPDAGLLLQDPFL